MGNQGGLFLSLSLSTTFIYLFVEAKHRSNGRVRRFRSMVQLSQGGRGERSAADPSGVGNDLLQSRARTGTSGRREGGKEGRSGLLLAR